MITQGKPTGKPPRSREDQQLINNVCYACRALVEFDYEGITPRINFYESYESRPNNRKVVLQIKFNDIFSNPTYGIEINSDDREDFVYERVLKILIQVVGREIERRHINK